MSTTNGQYGSMKDATDNILFGVPCLCLYNVACPRPAVLRHYILRRKRSLTKNCGSVGTLITFV